MANVRIDANDVSSLADLERLKADFCAAVGSNATVDLSNVKKMSMLLLQLLLAAHEAFKAGGHTLTFTSGSGALLDTLTAAGLSDLRNDFAMDTTS
ncbi:MAG: STAS domain-containing protein [Rhizobiales bacterium]|nr:STAS domain-containing protein [Hyphomicrobiales bacterium]